MAEQTEQTEQTAQSYVSCLSDEFIQVRRRDGSLLGVLPRLPEGIDTVQTSDGTPCPIMQGIILGIIVPDTVDPRALAGFMPRPGARLDPGALEEDR